VQRGGDGVEEQGRCSVGGILMLESQLPCNAEAEAERAVGMEEVADGDRNVDCRCRLPGEDEEIGLRCVALRCGRD
jgi:hypothetical protein